MSLIQKVTEFIAARGRGDLDGLVVKFPNYTRGQLTKALANAQQRGLIHLLVKPQQLGRTHGCRPGIWGPKPEDHTPSRVDA
jgi:hypothetical protein